MFSLFRIVVVALALAASLSGCDTDDSNTMPEVTGKQLDVAKRAIKDAGFDGEVEVDSTGMFGVIDDENWVVCEQDPAAGEALDSPHLKVDRSCPEAESGAGSEEPTASTPAETTETAEGSTTPPTSTESNESSTEPTEETPAPTEPVTAANNKGFAKILRLGDYCDPAIGMFAHDYRGQTIRFDGYISNIAKHGSYDTRFDLLLGAGDYDPNAAAGPYFQYQDVSLSYDMHWTGPRQPSNVHNGDEFTFTAKVGSYSAGSCLFGLSPVKTQAR